LTGVQGSSASIDANGQVFVAFNASPNPALLSTIMGRRFDASGNPIGATFYISETESPNLTTPVPRSDNPKASIRNGKIAVAWLSRNYPDPSFAGRSVITYRLFDSTPPALSISRTGNTVTVSWSPAATAYTLESSPSLSSPSWTAVPGVVNNSVSVTNPSGVQFYRLRR
jgi:hypothetical protein